MEIESILPNVVIIELFRQIRDSTFNLIKNKVK